MQSSCVLVFEERLDERGFSAPSPSMLLTPYPFMVLLGMALVLLHLMAVRLGRCCSVAVRRTPENKEVETVQVWPSVVTETSLQARRRVFKGEGRDIHNGCHIVIFGSISPYFGAPHSLRVDNNNVFPRHDATERPHCRRSASTIFLLVQPPTFKVCQSKTRKTPLPDFGILYAAAHHDGTLPVASNACVATIFSC